MIYQINQNHTSQLLLSQKKKKKSQLLMGYPSTARYYRETT